MRRAALSLIQLHEDFRNRRHRATWKTLRKSQSLRRRRVCGRASTHETAREGGTRATVESEDEDSRNIPHELCIL